MTFNIQASTLSADEIIAAIARATELRPRDGRDAVARRVYEQIVKPLMGELEVSVPDYPETLPCPVMLEPGLRFGKGVPTRSLLAALQRRAGYYAELEAMTPEQRAEHEAGKKEFAALVGCKGLDNDTNR
ncbi:hypothetical protein [Enterobacter kobei]|uniref:hypothetical protein n=1 Tax=Enterobacter kobei TaxID=208224 RepID=UPI003CF97B2B